MENVVFLAVLAQDQQYNEILYEMISPEKYNTCSSFMISLCQHGEALHNDEKHVVWLWF